MSTVDYRMARRAVLQGLRRGLVSRYDVCDAHPELLRAARHLGEEIGDPCPVCEDPSLRIVLYTYGKGRREHGRARRHADVAELRHHGGEFRCYVVEVCVECSWNHLVRSFATGHDRAASAG